MEIILNILKEDIMSSEYSDIHDCAMARAANRVDVKFFNLYYDHYDDYKRIDKRVREMYAYIDKREHKNIYKFWGISTTIPPEDFTFILKTE